MHDPDSPANHTVHTSADADVWREIGDEPAPIAQPPGLWRRARGWLLFAIIVTALGAGFVLAGRHFYQPDPRIPSSPAHPYAQGLYGITQPVAADLERLAALAGESPALQDEVFELAFPRTVADRLFGKRDETARVYTVALGDSDRRVLAFYDAGRRALLAVESPSLRAADGLPGVFIALPEPSGQEAPLMRLAEALHAGLDELEGPTVTRLDYRDYTIFGPFAHGDSEELRRRIEANVVMSHMAGEIAAAQGDVSLTAPVFLLRPTPPTGVILALYMPAMRLIKEPLWGTDSSTATLAHELAHAQLDTVLPDSNQFLLEAADYLETAHPRLFGQVVSELYESLGPAGRAEEALAFIAGSVASGDTRTVASARVLEEQGYFSIVEPILTSDLEWLLRAGLIPACMDPAALGHDASEISSEYYRRVQTACE